MALIEARNVATGITLTAPGMESISIPFPQDCWRRIRIGGVLFSVVKPCDRCIVTTIDPETGQRPDRTEPLRTLGTFRRDRRGGVMFGQNLIPENAGRIAAGDRVEVLEYEPPNVMLMATARQRSPDDITARIVEDHKYQNRRQCDVRLGHGPDNQMERITAR